MPKGSQCSCLRILVIDDDAMVREVVALMLKALGHAVVEASGGAEGLAILEAGEAVDLVLTDLHMPEPSGWQIVKQVKARWPGVRVGVMTGTPEVSYDEEAEVDFIIEKPFNFASLGKALAPLGP